MRPTPHAREITKPLPQLVPAASASWSLRRMTYPCQHPSRRGAKTSEADWMVNMRIVMLYLDEPIQRFIRELSEVEGHSFTSTTDPLEALRAIEVDDTECVLLTDNFHVNSVIRDALTTLRDNPALHDMTWVIGLNSWKPLTQEFLDQGLLDDYLPMPFKNEEYLAAIDRAFEEIE